MLIWNGLLCFQLLCQEEKQVRTTCWKTEWQQTHVMFGKSFVRHILQEAHSGLLGPWKAYIVEVGTISTPIVWSPCILCICKKITDINVQSQYTGPLKNVNYFCVISGVELPVPLGCHHYAYTKPRTQVYQGIYTASQKCEHTFYFLSFPHISLPYMLI